MRAPKEAEKGVYRNLGKRTECDKTLKWKRLGVFREQQGSLCFCSRVNEKKRRDRQDGKQARGQVTSCSDGHSKPLRFCPNTMRNYGGILNKGMTWLF